MIDPAAHARLDGWKQSLLDSGDPLLDLGDGGLPVRGDPVRLAFVLGAGGGLELDADDRQIAPLRRAARDARGDGDHALWLGLGLLAWDRGRLAPVVLWPVELAADGRLVTATGRAPRLNDMLAHALRAHDATLEMQGELELAEVLRAAGAIADGHADWRLERTARLAICSFARFDLWRDVDSRELAASAPVAWISGALPRPELPAPLAEVVAPLDADASQLAAIGAAAAGGSFVLHGPPGTGKSQTIANIVVDCTSRGKTVLVVSDRIAALDSVRKRLAALGLADFCAALHGAPAAVIETLGRVLDRAFRPGAGPSTDPARLGELRGALDAHRAALHDVGAFGMSPYEVLARLVELRTTPRAALAERDAPIMDRGMFSRRFNAVCALASAARAVEPVGAHPWRAATFESWSYERVARAKDALGESRTAVEQLAGAVADVG
ncbi:MAG: AAA domain-containing protein, partial [Acidobacteriota bacterium]